MIETIIFNGWWRWKVKKQMDEQNDKDVKIEYGHDDHYV